MTLPWPSYHPSLETIEKAKFARAQLDVGGSNLFEKPDRWAGFVGEDVAAAWAMSAGVEVVQNGGLNDLPDLVLNGRSVGVKTRARGERYLYQTDLLVPMEHINKPWDYWLFLIMLAEPPHLTMVIGAISPSAFVTHATPADHGHPCLSLPQTHPYLLKPHIFLEDLGAP